VIFATAAVARQPESATGGEGGTMDSLLQGDAFRTYAVCCAILGLKVLFSAFYTGAQRQKSRGYINAEDARVFGKGGVEAGAVESAEVAHGLRIQRNDAENIPTFYALGLVYVLSGASPTGAFWYCWTYAIARVLHTVMYINHWQPWRAICFGIGVACQIGMAASILF
jgi:glutathione S-transferase